LVGSNYARFELFKSFIVDIRLYAVDVKINDGQFGQSNKAPTNCRSFVVEIAAFAVRT